MSGLDVSNGHLVGLDDALLFDDALNALSEMGDCVSIDEDGIPKHAVEPNGDPRDPKPDDTESAFVVVEDDHDD